MTSLFSAFLHFVVSTFCALGKFYCVYIFIQSLQPYTRSHTHTHACVRARTHTHARAHTHSHYHNWFLEISLLHLTLSKVHESFQKVMHVATLCFSPSLRSISVNTDKTHTSTAPPSQINVKAILCFFVLFCQEKSMGGGGGGGFFYSLTMLFCFAKNINGGILFINRHPCFTVQLFSLIHIPKAN